MHDKKVKTILISVIILIITALLVITILFNTEVLDKNVISRLFNMEETKNTIKYKTYGTSEDKTKAKAVITITNEGSGIKELSYGDIVIYGNGKNTVSFDYEMVGDEIYYFDVEEKNGTKERVKLDFIISDGILTKIDQIENSGITNIEANSKTYSANIIVHDGDLVLDGTTPIEGAKLENNIYEFGEESDCGTQTSYAKNMILLKVNGNITINPGITLTTSKNSNGYGGPKGFLIYCTGKITNNGIIDMTDRGAYSPGEDIYLWQNTNATFELIPAVGGEGGKKVQGIMTHISGDAGKNGENRQTGGGGSGASKDLPDGLGVGLSGAGSAGTSYSGGTGGGGQAGYEGHNGENGGANGGKGGNQSNIGSGGGAGNPGGNSDGDTGSRWPTYNMLTEF